MTIAHDYDCPWNFGHDCTCGAGNSTGAIGSTQEPRPAAQDAEECYPGRFAVIEDIAANVASGNRLLAMITLDKYAESFRRPSLPMSAEVEKAVETVRRYIDSPRTVFANDAMHDFDLIVAALNGTQKDKVIDCPSCGAKWNISRDNACACGASLKARG